MDSSGGRGGAWEGCGKKVTRATRVAHGRSLTANPSTTCNHAWPFLPTGHHPSPQAAGFTWPAWPPSWPVAGPFSPSGTRRPSLAAWSSSALCRLRARRPSFGCWISLASEYTMENQECKPRLKRSMQLPVFLPYSKQLQKCLPYP